MEKRFRLRKSNEFKLVRNAGRSWAHPLLVLYARPNGLDHSRVGFSVSKRIGNAVTRNRVKRLLREAVRARWSGVAPGWDLLLIARGPVAGARLAPVSAATAQLWERSGLSSSPPVREGEPRRASLAGEKDVARDTGHEA